MRRPRYALLTGSAALITLLLRRVLRQRRHRPLLPRPGAHGLDLAGDPRRRRDRRSSSRPSADRRRRRAAVRRGRPRSPGPSHRPGRRRDRRRPRRGPPRPDRRPPPAPLRGRRREPPARRGQLGRTASSTSPSRTRAIVSWWSYSTPLWYAQRVEGERPDVAIIDDRTRLDENLGGLTDDHRRQPREAARLRHPGRPARGQAPGRALRARLHRRHRREQADQGHRAQGSAGS